MPTRNQHSKSSPVWAIRKHEETGYSKHADEDNSSYHRHHDNSCPAPSELHTLKSMDANDYEEYLAVFNKYHKEEDDLDQEQKLLRAFRKVPKTGVIFATSRARELGYQGALDPNWSNLGQGAPEVGPIPDAPHRNHTLTLDSRYEEYGPTNGDYDVRCAIANYYNEFYRHGKSSKYTAANVCLVPGGRMGITRVMSVLGDVQVGYFRPDYTAYEQCLSLFINIRPTALLHKDPLQPLMDSGEFERQCRGLGLGAVVMSNPCNPTGKFLEDDELSNYVATARRHRMALVMDEFYSHYMYNGKVGKTISSASYVENVNEDPVIIINGLTKNWRCPGWRLCWVVGPSNVINMVAAAGSYMDGGPNHPLQKSMLPLMNIEFIRKDCEALQRHFKMKRDYMVGELRRIGIKVKEMPESTFYVWADVSSLPPPLNDCLAFFEMCARKQVITVPGVFFDLNPNHLRDTRSSPCLSYVRFSYGPDLDALKRGITNIEAVIKEWTEFHQVGSKDLTPEEALGFDDRKSFDSSSSETKDPAN